MCKGIEPQSRGSYFSRSLSLALYRTHFVSERHLLWFHRICLGHRDTFLPLARSFTPNGATKRRSTLFAQFTANDEELKINTQFQKHPNANTVYTIILNANEIFTHIDLINHGNEYLRQLFNNSLLTNSVFLIWLIYNLPVLHSDWEQNESAIDECCLLNHSVRLIVQRFSRIVFHTYQVEFLYCAFLLWIVSLLRGPNVSLEARVQHFDVLDSHAYPVC